MVIFAKNVLKITTKQMLKILLKFDRIINTQQKGHFYISNAI